MNAVQAWRSRRDLGEFSEHGSRSVLSDALNLVNLLLSLFSSYVRFIFFSPSGVFESFTLSFIDLNQSTDFRSHLSFSLSSLSLSLSHPFLSSSGYWQLEEETKHTF